MKNTDYAYAVSNIRAKENSLLSKSFTESLISARTYDDAVRLLTDKGFSYFEKPLSEALGIYMSEAWDCLSDAAPNKSELDFLIAENDFHNLKAIIKAMVADKDGLSCTMSPSVINPEDMQNAVKTKDFSALPDWISETAKEGYRIITSTGDGQLFDMFTDKSAYEAVIELSKDNKFSYALSQERAAQINIKTAFRLADFTLNDALCDYAFIKCDALDEKELKKTIGRGKEAVKSYLQTTPYSDLCDFDSICALEVSCDGRIKAMLDSAGLISFGIEPLISFYFAKKTECANLRLILTAKQSKLDEKIIRERLRDLYV